MTMDWTFPPAAGPEGIFEIGRRLAAELGRIPDATSFIQDAREMLRLTRRVETASRGGSLLVGFQTAAKLDVEDDRYKELVAAGTKITAFAAGRPSSAMDGIDYREQTEDTRRLANQWFLVSDQPEPIAFVSWELGDPGSFGVGGASSPGKVFVGFISDDPDVVASLAATLRGVRGVDRHPPRDPGTPSGIEARSRTLATEVQGLAIESTGAADGSVIVPVGRGSDGAAVRLALAIGRAERRRVVFVDRSGEGILASPYTDLRGDDALRPQRDRLFDVATAHREGRDGTAAAIDAARELQLDAGGWFPTASGAEGIRAAIERFSGAILVVPGDVRRPSIGERLRGMTVDSLERLGVPLVVA